MGATARCLLLVALMLPSPALAERSCPSDPDRGWAQLAGEGVQASVRLVPAAIGAGQPFSIEVALCGGDARALVRVDAHMPAHRHGMNYRPTISETAPGRYRADGFLFHMPGEWEVLVDVRVGERSQRLSHRLTVE